MIISVLLYKVKQSDTRFSYKIALDIQFYMHS